MWSRTNKITTTSHNSSVLNLFDGAFEMRIQIDDFFKDNNEKFQKEEIITGLTKRECF